MAIRKRTWSNGTKSAWVADYFDADGVRRQKTFKTKAEAKAWLAHTTVGIAQGTHIADNASITVAEAAKLWLARCRRDGLEEATTRSYEGHVVHHIGPLLGAERLSRLTAPRVQGFVDELLESGRSRALTGKIVRSLGAIVSEAQRRGKAAHNPVREARVRLPKRDKGRPEMPGKDELRALLGEASGRWHPLIVTAMFTGLRSSELRGLKWADVDLDTQVLHVRQRVDQWGTFGPPKSEAGTRDVPLAPMVVNTLREWKLTCPKGELGLVFPNGAGKVESHANILNRCFYPLQIAASIVSADGRPKYSLHALRHAAAALFIEQGFPAKRVQAIIGHSSIQMTFDLYGYLFDALEEDRMAMQQLEARLLHA